MDCNIALPTSYVTSGHTETSLSSLSGVQVKRQLKDWTGTRQQVQMLWAPGFLKPAWNIYVGCYGTSSTSAWVRRKFQCCLVPAPKRDHRYLVVYTNDRVIWKCNTEAVYSGLYFLRKLLSFNVCTKMFYIVHKSVVGSTHRYEKLTVFSKEKKEKDPNAGPKSQEAERWWKGRLFQFNKRSSYSSKTKELVNKTNKKRSWGETTKLADWESYDKDMATNKGTREYLLQGRLMFNTGYVVMIS